MQIELKVCPEYGESHKVHIVFCKVHGVFYKVHGVFHKVHLESLKKC